MFSFCAKTEDGHEYVVRMIGEKACFVRACSNGKVKHIVGKSKEEFNEILGNELKGHYEDKEE